MKLWIGGLVLVGLLLGLLTLVLRDTDSSRPARSTTEESEPASPRSVTSAPQGNAIGTLEPEEPTRRTPLDVTDGREASPAAKYVVYGRVLDGETGRPLAASVEALTAYGGKSTRTKADEQGLFRLALDAPSAGVLVRHAEFAAAMLAVAEEHATPESAAVVELFRAASLLVQVADRRSGPGAGLEVRLQADAYSLHGPAQPFWWYTSWLDLTWSGTVDGAGKVVFEGLPPNVPVQVDVFEAEERIHRLSEPLSLAIGEERELAIELGVDCRIVGYAVEVDGTAAADLPVWLMPADEITFVKYFAAKERRDVRERGETDAAGEFAFENVPPGEWWVGPAPRREGGSTRVSADDPAPLAERVSIVAGQDLVEVQLVVHRGLTIEGQVTGWHGERVRRARVWARRPGLVVEAQNGQFQLGPLVPGEYELVGVPIAGGAYSEPVRALAGDHVVVIRLRRAGSIAGSVHGLDGRRTEAVVELVPAVPDDAVFTRRKGESLAPGDFAFRGLVPGTYHLCAHDEKGNVGRSEAIVVEAGVDLEGLSVELLPGATIRARLPTRESGPFLGFRVLQSGVEMGIAFPQVHELVLPVLPGPATVELLSYDPCTLSVNTLDTLEVEAVAGQETEVDFDRDRAR